MAVTDCFANVPVETVNHCPNDNTVGGLSIDLFYIPASQVETLTLPTITDTTGFADRQTITALTPATGKGFKRLSVMTDENELTANLVGNKGNKKPKVELDVLLPNFKKQNIGFVNTHKNTPMIYAIKDSTGQAWIIGTKNAPAFFETAEAKTGKKYDDNSGVTLKISANTQLYAFEGTIVEI